MKGFAGILILFTMLIAAIFLMNSTYPLKSEENNLSYIPQVKNFITIYELNLKNMAYDCNWQETDTNLEKCLNKGLQLIFKSSQNDPLLSCISPSILRIDENTYSTDLNCTNKIILQKNTTFYVQKTVYITSPLQ